jgi:hypothetical protein
MDGEKRTASMLFVSKPDGKRPVRRSKRRWVDNITVDLVDISYGDVDWIGLVQDKYRRRALVNAVMNLRVPRNVGLYRVAAQVVAYRVVLSSTELVR